MALLKIKDFDSDYRDTFGGYDLKGLEVYSDVNNEKIGSVQDLLVDEQGHFRYFILDLGFWGFGKKVLLPVGRAQIDNDGRQLQALGFTKEQAENLPEFNESLKVDRDYEEKVRKVYRPSSIEPPMRPLEEPTGGYIPTVPTSRQSMSSSQTATSPMARPQPATPPPRTQTAPTASPQPNVQPMPTEVPLSSGQPMGGSTADPYQQQNNMPPTAPEMQAPMARQVSYQDPSDYNYQQDVYLYGMNQQRHSVLQRYEERLMSKKRQTRQAR